MKNGKQTRAVVRPAGTERDNDDDMDVDVEENFLAKMTEIIASSKKKGKSNLQVGKNAIFKRVREEANQLSQETLVSVQEAREKLKEIMAETARESSMGDFTPILSRRDKAVGSLIEEYGFMSTEVSPMRSDVINSASSTLQEQQEFYEESRRKIIGGAKSHVERGIEMQRMATDASELIRHYNALLRLPTSK